MLIIRWWKLIPLHQYCRLAMVSVQRQPRRWHGSWSRTGEKNAGMCDQRSLSAQREFPCRTTLFFGLDQKKTTTIHKTMKINIGKVQMSMALIPPPPTSDHSRPTNHEFGDFIIVCGSSEVVTASQCPYSLSSVDQLIIFYGFPGALLVSYGRWWARALAN